MKRTESQRIGELGESLVVGLVEKSGDWIVRKQEKDYGLDLEIELVQGETVSGKIVKIQVKSTEKVPEIIDYKIQHRVNNDFLQYCFECRIPILLVLMDVKRNIGFYIWVQEYLKNHSPDFRTRKTSNVWFNSVDDFEDGLQTKIKSIALGKSITQIKLDLAATIETAFQLGDKEVYENLLGISDTISKTYSLEIDSAINDLISLEIKAWGTFEGNKKSNIMYELCRKYGDQFTPYQVEKMVVRGFSYSRVGIIALGILYNEFPNYIASLNLPDVFEKYHDQKMRYYCLLRERYLGEMNTKFWFSKDVNYEIERFYMPQEGIERLTSKWPNRGDSAVLDYIMEKEEK